MTEKDIWKALLAASLVFCVIIFAVTNLFCGGDSLPPKKKDFSLAPLDAQVLIVTPDLEIPYCGDGICQSERGETILSCFKDCKPIPVPQPNPRNRNPKEQIIDPPGD